MTQALEGPDARVLVVADKSGAFAALEQPATFVSEARAAFRLVR